MSETETLCCTRAVSNMLLHAEPETINWVAENVRTELGKGLADKICDGKTYIVRMKNPYLESEGKNLYQDCSVFRGSVAVTPLVYCGECKYFDEDEWCYWRDEAITADGFCSYGERENNE